MGFNFDGHVLRAPRNAPGNAVTSSEPDNAVVRDIRVPPNSRTAAQPDIVDLMGDQYRAAILNAPGTTPNEFLVWAANSAQIAVTDDPSWWTEEGAGRVPVGTIVITNPSDPRLPYKDGTLKLVVTDDGGRDISTISHVVIARGDVEYDDSGWVDEADPSLGRKGSVPYPVVVPASADQNPLSGVVSITDDNVFTSSGGLAATDIATLLTGGLSLERGDVVVSVRYTVSPQTFWWTRNDRYETRFGWDSKLQRWVPYKGAAPANLGALLFDGSYSLSPKPRSLPVGAVLEGDATAPDQYAALRVGPSPGVLSTPVGINDPDGFTGVEIVADALVEDTFDFSTTTAAAVVGQTNGILQFAPNFIEKHAGKTVWYSFSSFPDDADGILGNLVDADSDPLYLAPIPGPTDHPFIRINHRSPLVVSMVPTEADLPDETDEGTCVIALSTGRVFLSQTDINKANSEKTAEFNKHFLGAQVVYDGTALNAMPQPTKRPVALVQDDGVTETVHPSDPMYLRPADLWPEDAGEGLQRSGVLYLPDGTGSVPNPEGVAPGGVPVPVRAGGDTLPPPGGGVSPQSIGLIRQISDGVSDTILFSKDGAIEETVVVDRLDDLPKIPLFVPGGKAYISREGVSIDGVIMSQVQLSAADRNRFANEKVYFLQAALQPSTYTNEARIYSKSRIIFRFETEAANHDVLYFAINGVAHEWHADTLADQEFYSAEEVAESIQTKITTDGGTGICRAEASRVVLEAADPTTGTVEIGWGDPRDLSGSAALGFLPGWRAVGGQDNWLSDSGTSLGMARSLLNLDRSKPTADYRQRLRLDDEVLVGSIAPTPFVFIDYPPIEDIAGFDEGVFFNLQTVALQGDDLQVIDKRLEHFGDIQHQFSESKFAWLDQTVSSNSVQTRQTSLSLGKAGVVPESMLGAPGIGGAVLAAEDGGRFVFQKQGRDYIVPEDGQPGVVQLVTRYGDRYTFGAAGQFTAGGTTFEDANADFLADSDDPLIDPLTGSQALDGTGELLWEPVVRPGFRLKLASGEAQGSYIVQSVTDATHFEVLPPFPATAERASPWEVFGGIPDDLYDPAILADVVYREFDHLPEEPFRVRTLSPTGVISTATPTDFRASVEDANAKGRPISLRFGPVHADTGAVASLAPLTTSDLGIIANDSLVLPDDAHVSNGAFRIAAGTETFHAGTDILAVAAFSANPVAVEYLTAAWDDGTVVHPKGELKFNDTLLTDLETSTVLYVEELLPSALLDQGEAQYDPKTGALRISDADSAAHVGKTVYFTEQMITTGGGDSDVAISPMAGSVSFRKPVNKGVLVEMEYFMATSEGRRVGEPGDEQVEFLPVFVRREECTRLADDTFQIDPTGEHVIDDRIEPIVYVGPTQQNFGSTDFTVVERDDLNGRILTFKRNLPAWAIPVATYAVFDAQGGERAYETSLKPVYRPPFYVKAGVNSFGLRGDRTADFEPGQLMRIGSECFYIVELTYIPDRDVTKMEIYPPTATEVGSRSPGNDVLTLVTGVPITTTLFPDSAAPVTTSAKAGFMQQIPLADFPFEPVNANQNSITFTGDLTTFAVAGHVMEVAGLPFTIASSQLSEDGARTTITFTSPFRNAVDPSGDPTVKLSYRPIYPPDVRTFLGIGPLVDSEGVGLTLFGETDSDGNELPGRELAQSTEWEIDAQTGVVSLLEPLQSPLGPTQRLMVSFTQLRVMEPFYADGRVVFPRWAVSFRHNVIPDETNGFLKGRVTATYTFDHPDTFYYRTLTLRNYLGEAVTEALDELKQGQSGGGPRLTRTQREDNWTKGNLGLAARRRALLDKDRAARILLSFYNDTVNFFEQVEETITGKFIGDRDGKFRFWYGRGLEYAPPGYEDDITGILNPNYIFTQVYNEEDPTRDITFIPGTDPLVRPQLAEMNVGDTLVLEGEPMPVDQVRRLADRQISLVRNDVDDYVLLGLSRPRIRPTNTFPFLTVVQNARYSQMGQTHRYSRLFPTNARVFFTTIPGIGADIEGSGYPGVYAWQRVNEETGESESTFRQQIGQIGNPVLGDIENISEKLLQSRLPRARIFGYYPDGLDASVFGTAVSEPCLVVSMVPLSDLPIDPSTGFPLTTEFLSQPPGTGSTPDAEAGHPEMALPGFKRGQKIAWGLPTGQSYAAAYPEEVNLFGNATFTGIFVHDVQFGCVLRLEDRKGDLISDPANIMVALAQADGQPAHVFGIGRSDTVYVVPPDGENPISDPDNESPTMANLQAAAALQPGFRMGLDMVVKPDGRVIDISMPSWDDPFLFPIKEMLGQRPPEPLSHLEGEVDFIYSSPVPLSIPALEGEALDDSGDNRIPYIKGSNTELDRFDEIGGVIGGIMARDAVLGGYYPDEILFENGVIVAAAVAGGGDYLEPACLNTETANGSPDFGEAPGREGDFVIVEVNTASPKGWQGLLSVGRLRTGVLGGNDHMWIEPPRFTTQAGKGSPMRYTLENYAVWTTPGSYPTNPQVTNPAGVRLFEDITNFNTILSFQDVVFTLNEGDPAGTPGVGNLNTILAASPNNIVRIKILSRPDDTAVNSPAGPATYTAIEKDGRVHLDLLIRQNDARVMCALGSFDSGWIAHGGVSFGDFDVTDPGSEGAPGPVADHRHIIISGWTELPLFPVPGQEAEWFLPYDHIDPGGPTDRKISKYGWEFTIDVATDGAGQSTSATIEPDRLTFTEVIDFRLSRPRGFEHELAPYTYETMLKVKQVTLGSGGFSTVNDVYGGSLTFLSRTGSSDSIEGTWAPGLLGAEVGSVRVMGLEFNNSDVTEGASPVTSIIAALQASQTKDEVSGIDILSGEGTAEKQRILPNPLSITGSVTSVEKGDVVYISKSTDPVNTATQKAGTFIVRHAVDPSSGPDLYLAVEFSSYLGTGGGFITVKFPRIVSLDWGTGELVVTDASMLPSSGKLFVTLNAAAMDDADPAVWQKAVFSVDWTAVTPGVGTYTLTLGAANTIRWADDSIVAVPLTEITLEMVEGKLMGWHDAPVGGAGASPTGIMELPISVRGGPLPDDSSVVGHHSPGGGATDAAYGFHNLRLDRSGVLVDFGTANMLDGAVTPTPLAGQVSVFQKTVHANETFDSTNEVAVYNEVPGTLRIHVSDPQGLALNAPNVVPPPASAVGVACALPGILARTFDGANAFFAAGGVWLEPSTPMYPVDLDFASSPNVVDSSRSMGAGDVGMRDPTTPEDVVFEVRRVRRWHGQQNGVNNAFQPLRFAYEIRRGIVDGFTRNEQQIGTLTTAVAGFTMDWNTTYPAKTLVADAWNTGETGLFGTQLGGFDDSDVNINPGDILRVLNDEDEIIGEGIVSEVIDRRTIKLAAPGIPEMLTADVVGKRFEVWLRQAPVPHEQSNEQLLGMITDKIVHETKADRSNNDPANWTGGYVPELAVGTGWVDGANKLYDDKTLGGSAVNFTALGVMVGDIVVIDPAGNLPVNRGSGAFERGFRPLGDRGVPTKTATDPGGGPAPTPYAAGEVSSLDDNRGFYRVKAVHDTFLEVDPAHTFGGDSTADVIMGSFATNLAYAVLPTVSDSQLAEPTPNTGEGQNDLRPTRLASGNTYTDNLDGRNDKHSLRPFSYRIIRPTSMVSVEVVDSILFMRERMLSLIEMLRSAMLGGRGGLYWDWQNGDHVEDLGDPLDPESGQGLFPNRLIRTLIGEVDKSPFVNTSDCLSLLDRRFWILDRRLDSMEPDPDNQFAMQEASGVVPFDRVGGPYTAYTDTSVTKGALVRPVLLDHLDQILDVRDRLRAIRFTWLTYRTHRFVGTLSRIRAYDSSLPEKLEDRKRALLLEASASKAIT